MKLSLALALLSLLPACSTPGTTTGTNPAKKNGPSFGSQVGSATSKVFYGLLEIPYTILSIPADILSDPATMGAIAQVVETSYPSSAGSSSYSSSSYSSSSSSDSGYTYQNEASSNSGYSSPSDDEDDDGILQRLANSSSSSAPVSNSGSTRSSQLTQTNSEPVSRSGSSRSSESRQGVKDYEAAQMQKFDNFKSRVLGMSGSDAVNGSGGSMLPPGNIRAIVLQKLDQGYANTLYTNVYVKDMDISEKNDFNAKYNMGNGYLVTWVNPNSKGNANVGVAEYTFQAKNREGEMQSFTNLKVFTAASAAELQEKIAGEMNKWNLEKYLSYRIVIPSVLND